MGDPIEVGPVKLYSEQVMIPTDNLVPNTWNPNEMDPKKFELLREEIRLFGWVGNPLVVRVHPKYLDSHVEGAAVSYEIIDGENRWKAGKAEGMTEVPCVILTVPPEEEVSFRTYVLNNLRGEINEVKLAVLIDNWHKKGISTNAIFKRIGLRGHKQRALMESLKPKDMSKKAFSGQSKGQHKSFAVILTLEEGETLHRAIKLTRLHESTDCLMAIVDHFLDHHVLTKEQNDQVTQLLADVEVQSDAQGLIELCKYYLDTVKKSEIRKDE